MSRIVRRFGTRQTLTGEAFSSYDGQAKASYAAGVSFEGIVQEMRELVRENDGNEVTLTLGVWVSPDADFIPAEKDRLAYDGSNYIVHTRRTVRSLHSGSVTHYKVVCHDE